MRMSDKTADVLKHAAQTKRDRSPVEADKLRAAAIMNHVMPELERRLLQNLCIATENAPAIDDKTRQALYGDFSLGHGGDFSLGFADVQSAPRTDKLGYSLGSLFPYFISGGVNAVFLGGQ